MSFVIILPARHTDTHRADLFCVLIDASSVGAWTKFLPASFWRPPERFNIMLTPFILRRYAHRRSAAWLRAGVAAGLGRGVLGGDEAAGRQRVVIRHARAVAVAAAGGDGHWVA